MTPKILLDPNRRHEFVLFFDVTDGNPNGDPDAGNLPRVDPETMQGIVTDVCLKRKVRNWIDATRGEESRYKIYVQAHGDALNTKHHRAYEAKNIKPIKGKLKGKQPKADIWEAQKWMCDNFYDIRMFGAVMSTGDHNCGQVRGPLQLTFGRSITPILPLDLSITRVAITRENDAARKETEMGRKAIIPYGLYRTHGFFTPHFAKKTGVTPDDLAAFWEALTMMWDLDRSASRGTMTCRGLYIFSHEHSLGNAPAQELFDRITIMPHENITAFRSHKQYDLSIREENLPDTVTLTPLVDTWSTSVG